MRKSVFSLLACLSFVASAASARADIISYVQTTNPLAFFPLQSQGQGSIANGYTTTYMNGASDVPSLGGPQANAVLLNGVDNGTPQYVSTSLSGGISGSGSISAFINLAAPVTGIDYIAGESQNGNDFDFQLVADDANDTFLRFYTQGGSYTSVTLSNSVLIGNWNLVTATDDSVAGVQDIYLNGQLVATANNGGNGAKVDQFTIGYTPTFGGRDFDGEISDVGIWNYALSAAQVEDIDSPPASPTGPTSVTPEPSSLVLLGSGMLGLAGAVRRRFKR